MKQSRLLQNSILTKFVKNNQFDKESYLQTILSIGPEGLKDTIGNAEQGYQVQEYGVFEADIFFMRSLLSYLTNKDQREWNNDPTPIFVNLSISVINEFPCLNDINLLQELREQVLHHANLLECRQVGHQSTLVDSIEYLSLDKMLNFLSYEATIKKTHYIEVLLKGCCGLVSERDFQQLKEDGFIVKCINNKYEKSSNFEELVIKRNKQNLKEKIKQL